MYLLSLLQGEKETHIALFERLENGREFVSKIPGYRMVEEVFEDTTFIYESIQPAQLGDYLELEYKGNRLPLTKFMFDDSEQVDVIWREFTNFDISDQGMSVGSTRVDAYLVEHSEVKTYIAKREKAYHEVKQILNDMDYIVERAFHGSEDGEAILIRKKGEDVHFFAHMDPSFVEQVPCEEEEIKRWVIEQLNAD